MNRPMTHPGFTVAMMAGLLVFSEPAAAHLVTTGLGPVYDGVYHLLVTPADLVPVLSLALLAGLQGARASRWAMLTLPVAWLIGGGAAVFTGVGAELPATVVSPAAFLLLGGLVAADLHLSPRLIASTGLLLGFAWGLGNGAALREGPGMTGLIGITATLFVTVTLVCAFVVRFGQFWPRIAVRVTGSWIAAIGLLMVGWSLKEF